MKKFELHLIVSFVIMISHLIGAKNLNSAVWYQTSYNDFSAGVLNQTAITGTGDAASVVISTMGAHELSTTVYGSTVVALYHFNNPPAELSADQYTVGLWHMNEASWNGTPGEVVDSSGKGNHGTAYNGANTVTNGMFGTRCGSFDGVNDYVDLGNGSSLKITDALTLECWVKTTNTNTGELTIVSWHNTTISEGWFLEKYNNTAQFWYGQPGGIRCDSGVTINDGKWHHISGVYNGSETLYIYVDGRFKNSVTCAGDTPVTSANILIGAASPPPTSPWDGLIEEVRISSTALSAAEIALDAGAAYDSSAFGNHGALNIATQTYTNSISGLGNCLQFNGVSDWVDIGNSSILNINRKFTIEMWLNTLSLGNTFNFIGRSNGGDSQLKWEFQRRSGYINFHFQNPAGTTYNVQGNSWNPTVGRWYHVAITRDDNVWNFYIDGISAGSASNSVDLPNPSTLKIGGPLDDPLFTGYIDEVRITLGALTASQIAEDAGILYFSSGTYRSSVFDTTAENAKVFYSSWSPTNQPGNTAISVALRASNTSFGPNDSTPSWVWVSNGSNPNLTGRYIQWMSTFTTTNSTTTPSIDEITLSYICPPWAPSINNITADNYHQITWRWQDNSSGIRQEDNFKIYTSTGGLIATINADTTYYPETGLERNKEYARYVQAYNAAGSSNSATIVWRTKPGTFQSKVSQGNPVRSGNNAFGFFGDGSYTWQVPVKSGSPLTITCYVRYNTQYGGSATKPKITLSGKGISTTSVSASAAAENAWELLTINAGTPTQNGILLLTAEGFSNNPGARFWIDDISVNQ